MSFIAIDVKCCDVCFLSTELNTTLSQSVGVTSAPQTEGAITTSRTVPVGSSIQPTIIDGAIAKTETTLAICSIHSSEGTITTTRTVPVNSSTQPTNNLPSDGTTTTLVIIVVAVVIILVVIVIGVVLLVILVRTKKRKQHLVIKKLLNMTTENEDIEMKLKHEVSIEKETTTPSYCTDQPLYAEAQTEAPPNVASKSEDLVNLNSPLTIGYSEIELEPDDSKQTSPCKTP